MAAEIQHSASDADESVFAERVRLNQRELRASLKDHYDFIVCGSGSSGSVVARRLAENSSVQVLLLEAGGWDDVPEVREAVRWTANYASERDWNFLTEPSADLNGRRMHLAMGKVVGGGSSINAMAWAWGHKNDWDFFSSEAGDPTWSYRSVLEIYRRIEDWHGAGRNPDTGPRRLHHSTERRPPHDAPIGASVARQCWNLATLSRTSRYRRRREEAGRSI